MRFWKSLVWCVGVGVLAACPGSEDETSGDAGPGGESYKGDKGDKGDKDVDGVYASGTFNGEAFEIECAPPSDYTIGDQFLHQHPANLFWQWAVRCRTDDQNIQLWFDLIDPVPGTTYTQPAAGDGQKVALGDPYDVQPLGYLSTNLEEMSITVEEADNETRKIKASFRAKWSDDGNGKYGEIEGTVNYTHI